MAFRKGPLLWSVGLSLLVSICFYFIDQGISTTRSYNELVDYSYFLATAKWLIIAGIVVKGILSGIVKE